MNIALSDANAANTACAARKRRYKRCSCSWQIAHSFVQAHHVQCDFGNHYEHARVIDCTRMYNASYGAAINRIFSSFADLHRRVADAARIRYSTYVTRAHGLIVRLNTQYQAGIVITAAYTNETISRRAG